MARAERDHHRKVEEKSSLLSAVITKMPAHYCNSYFCAVRSFSFAIATFYFIDQSLSIQ